MTETEEGPTTSDEPSLDMSVTCLDFGAMSGFAGAESASLPFLVTNRSSTKTFRVSLQTHSLSDDDSLVRLSIREFLEKSNANNNKPSASGSVKSSKTSSKADAEKSSSQNLSAKCPIEEVKTHVIIPPLSSLALCATLTVLPDPFSTFQHSSFYHIRGQSAVRYEVYEELCATTDLNESDDVGLDIDVEKNDDPEVSTANTPAEKTLPAPRKTKHIAINFTATMCTSLMYLDTKELNFNDCIAGQWSMHEVMMWNRSEASLQFSFQIIADHEGEHGRGSKSHAEIKVCDADTGKEILPNQVVTVPSYAPKMLIVKVVSKALGSFRPRIEFKNKNNINNTAILDIIGMVVKDRKRHLENVIIQEADSAIEWYCSNSTLPLDLGAFACGKTKVRKFWFVNNNPHHIQLRIQVTGDEGKEVRIIGEDDSTGDTRLSVLTGGGEEQEAEAPPVAKSESVKKVVKNTKPSESAATALYSGVTLSESEVTFCSAMAAGSKEPSSSWSSRSVAKFCGQWFGNEYLDWELSGARAHELNTEFGKGFCESLTEYRPFLDEISNKSVATTDSNQTASHPVVDTENAAVALDSSADKKSKLPGVFVDIPAADRRLLVLEVTPSEHFQVQKGTSKYEMVDRQCSICIHHGDEEDASAKVQLSYSACVSEISLTPTSYNVGLCNIGDAYPFTVLVSNMSALPALVTPSSSATNKDLELFPITVDAFDSKEVTLVFEPTVENHDYRNVITFQNADNKENTALLEVIANVVDAQHTQIHDLFYQILDSDSHYQSQLQFGKMLANMVNITSFRMKNTLLDPLKVEFLCYRSSSLAIFALEKKSMNSQSYGSLAGIAASTLSSDGGVVASAVDNRRMTEDAAPDWLNSRVVDLEDLKWGQRKKNNNRLSLDDDVDTRLRSSSRIGKDISQSINALDVLPNNFSKISLRNISADPISDSSAISGPGITVSCAAVSPAIGPTTPSTAEGTLEVMKLLQTHIAPWIFDEEDHQDAMLDNLSLESQFVQSLQKCYTNIDALISAMHKSTTSTPVAPEGTQPVDVNSSTEELITTTEEQQNQEEQEVRCTAVIPPESSVQVIVVWKPSSHGFEALSDIAASSQLREHILLRLPEVTLEQLQAMLLQKKTQPDAEGALREEHFLYNRNEETFSLAPRSLLVRGECFRSEMTIVQKNINFGRVIVGDSSKQSVTIINKSPVACVYAFSKSGNITSGFVSIVNGRKGVILPFSTKTVQISFKPTMPCTFEEVIQIKNLLNPADEHTLTIKAKVSRAESFALTVVDEPASSPALALSPAAIGLRDFDDSMDVCAATKDALQLLVESIYSVDKALDGNVDTAGSRSKAKLFLSTNCAAVGRNPTVIVKLKLRNPTNKRKQFVLDASSKDAITLLDKNLLRKYRALSQPPAEPKPSKEAEENENEEKKPKKKDKQKPSGEDRILEKLLDTNGRFVIPIPEYLENVLIGRCIFSSEVIKSGSSAENIDEDLVQSLMDNLEKFQQKLKIAIRKQKPDKILKYQKKIDDTIKKLSGANSAPTVVDDSKKEEAEIADPNATSDAGVIPLEDGESSQYIWLEPEEERLITLKISYFPGRLYKSWRGVLPFLGKIRVFEVKNEDVVKTITLGLGLFSSVASMESPTGEDTALIAETGRPITVSKSMSSLQNTSQDSINREFLVIIPQWCSFPTKQIYPKYKTLPQNTLGACVKLSRTSRDRTLTGKFTISSIFHQFGEVKISMDMDLEQNTIGYKTFDTKTCGELQLLTSEEASSASVAFSDTDDRFLKSWGHDRPQFDKKALTHNLLKSEFTFPLKPGSFRDFSLVWMPPMFLLTSKEEFRLVGALRLQFTSGKCSRMLTMPFICVYQHSSIVKVEKYHTLEKAAVGSFETYDVVIHNESAKQSLNYHVFMEKLTEKYSSRGSLEIMQGKTGRIPPLQSRIMKLRFYGTSNGRFEQKMWVQNANDSFDQRRIVFYANVVVSQTMFVTFPDLIYNADTGKYKPMDFGHLQIRNTEADLRGFDTSLDLAENAPFPLRIRNVSEKQLTVVAVPNLRNQCFVYSDKNCRELAVGSTIPAAGESCLFVVLKPADVDNKAKRHQLGGGEPDNVTAVTESHMSSARELNGGIRLIFFSHGEENSNNTSDEDTAATADVISEKSYMESHSLFSRKLFEMALSFKAIVGKSSLKASLFGGYEGINILNPSSIATDRFGEMKISNASEIFSLNYAFYDDPNVFFCSDLSSLEDIDPAQEGTNVKLIFATQKYGTLAALEEQSIRFKIIVGAELRGFFTKSIRLCNLDTNEIVEVCLALFVDSNKLQHASLCEENNKSPLIISDLHPFLSPSIYRCSSLFWLRNKVPLSTLLVPKLSNLEVVRSMRQPICSLIIRNVSATSLTLLPMSDLPIKIFLEAEEDVSTSTITTATNTTTSGAISNNEPESSKLSANKKEESSKVRFVSNTISHTEIRRRFKKCGDVFSVKPNTSIIVQIHKSSGMLPVEAARSIDMRQVAKGKIFSLQGYLCFVERINALQSMFVRPASSVEPTAVTSAASAQPPNSTAVEAPFTGTDYTITSSTDHFLPMLQVVQIDCDFLLPKLRVLPTEVDLGRIRLRSSHTFDLTVKNISQQDSLCVIDGIPPWIIIQPVIDSVTDLIPLERQESKSTEQEKESTKDSKADSSSPAPITCSDKLSAASENEPTWIRSEDGSRVLFYCRGNVSYAWKGLVNAVPDIQKSSVDFTVTSLPLTPGIRLEDTLSRTDLDILYLNPEKVTVKFKIDRRSALEISALSNEALAQIPTTESECSLRSLFQYRFLRSFLIPPAFTVEVNEPVKEFIGSYENMAVQCTIDETVVKQGCKLAVKNSFDIPLKISLHFEPLHPELMELIDLSCKFDQQPTTSIVDLLPEESVQVRIRAIPKINTKITRSLLNKISVISEVDLPHDKPPAVALNHLLEGGIVQQEGLANSLLKLRSGYCKLGKLYLRPSIEAGSSTTARTATEKPTLTESDGICIDLIGALKFGPTTRLLSEGAGLSAASGAGIVGGFVVDFHCDDCTASRGLSAVDESPSNHLVAPLMGEALPSPLLQFMDPKQEHTFYVSNPSLAPIRFKTSCSSQRFPGAAIRFDCDPLEEESKEINWFYTDTVCLIASPDEGVIPVGTAIKMTVRLVAGDPRDAVLFSEKLPGKDLHTHHKAGQGEEKEKHEQLLMCLPLEIWDVNSPLHPPSMLFAHISSQCYISPLRSLPITEVVKQKAPQDRALFRALTASESSDHIDDLAISSSGRSAPEDLLVIAPETSRTSASNIVPLLAPTAVWRLRGVTPHAKKATFSCIDLGRQLQRQEHIEWLVTVDNTATRKLRVAVEIYASGTAPSDSSKGIRLGQNGVVVPAQQCSSIVVYFNRATAGHFCGFLAFRDVDDVDAIHIVRATMRVVADDRRSKRIENARALSLPQVTSSSFMSQCADRVALQWLMDNMGVRFTLSDGQLFACSPAETSGQIFVLKACNHQAYRLQNLEIGTVSLKNNTHLALEWHFSTSAKWVNAVLRTDKEQRDVRLPSTVLLSPGEEMEIKIAMNPSSYKAAMVRSGVESESLMINNIKVEARIVGLITCVCRTLDDLSANIPLHELAK